MKGKLSMIIKKKLFVYISLIFWILPEVLFSPSIQIFYSFFSNGKIFRENYFVNAGNETVILIFVLQLLGLIYLAKNLEKRGLRVLACIILVITASALFLGYSLSNIGF